MIQLIKCNDIVRFRQTNITTATEESTCFLMMIQVKNENEIIINRQSDVNVFILTL